jgi:hypothetical protein
LFFKYFFDKFHFHPPIDAWAPHPPAFASRASTRTESSDRGDESRSQSNRLHEQLKSVAIAVMESPCQSTLIDVIATTGEFATRTTSMAAFGFHATAGELQKPLCFVIEMRLFRIGNAFCAIA